MALKLTPSKIEQLLSFRNGFTSYDDLPADLQDELMIHFMPEMPYGTAKARDGDPVEFIIDRVMNMGLGEFNQLVSAPAFNVVAV